MSETNYYQRNSDFKQSEKYEKRVWKKKIS